MKNMIKIAAMAAAMAGLVLGAASAQASNVGGVKSFGGLVIRHPAIAIFPGELHGTFHLHTTHFPHAVHLEFDLEETRRSQGLTGWVAQGKKIITVHDIPALGDTKFYHHGAQCDPNHRARYFIHGYVIAHDGTKHKVKWFIPGPRGFKTRSCENNTVHPAG